MCGTYIYTGYPEGAVRLVEAISPREGFFMVHHNGSWGAVCNDRNQFDAVDASVVCRQLGYGSVIGLIYGDWFTEDNVVVPEYFYSNLECTGSESTLMECPHSGTPSECVPHHLAGAQCSGKFKNTNVCVCLYACVILRNCML